MPGTKTKLVSPSVPLTGTWPVRNNALKGDWEDRMTGRMIDFDAAGTPAPGYLATPDAAMGPGGAGAGAPGVVVLHAWWGLTEPFRQVCDRLAEAGFMAIAPDLYPGKAATTVEEAQAFGSA